MIGKRRQAVEKRQLISPAGIMWECLASERKLAFAITPDDGEEMEQSRRENISEIAGRDESVFFG